MRYTGLIERYKDRLPVTDKTPIISLCEGNTPLIKLKNIPKTLTIPVDIYVKYEGLNPTGSFKDRGMTMAVSKALEGGTKAIICASTGNTSAAAAAYAASAGIASFVVIPDANIAMGKLAQAMIFGAKIIQIKGNFDDGMALVKEVVQTEDIALVNSVNPYRLQGQKTAAFEIVDALGDAPDYHALPVGNAGNISAYWLGYGEYFNDKVATKKPVMLGYQAAGAAPFISGKMVDNPETVATAIRIGHPQSWDKAMAAQQESNGWFDALTDTEILAMQKRLADTEGVFCEPASAASLAGVLRDIERGKIASGSSIVCTLTGNGLKDPDIAISQAKQAIPTIDPTMAAIKRVLTTAK